MKKELLLVLTAALLLGLTACGQKAVRETVYLPEDAAFATGLTRVESTCISGDFLYLLGTVRETVGEAGHRDRWALFRVPLEGGAGEELPFEVPFPKGDDDDMYRAAIRAGADGTVWVLDDTVIGGYDPAYILRQLDWDGEELYRFDSRSGDGDLLSRMGPSVWSLSDLIADAGGDLFARAESAVAALDREGNILYMLEADMEEDFYINATLHFVTLGDGRLGLLMPRKNEEGVAERWLQTIDKEAQDWGEAYLLPVNTQEVWPGDENALFYCQDSKTLYAWHEGDTEARRVLDWMDSRLDGNDVGALAFLDDGRIGVACCSYGTLAAKVRYTLLSEVDASQIPPRKELILGCISPGSDDRALINQFNSASPDYYITVEDYAVYQDDTGYIDWNASRTRMATKIAAGEIPDILDMRGLPLRQFGSREILEDLWPYIDNDPELGRESLMLRPLEAASQDGKLYLLSDTFGIETLVGRKSIVGDRMGWTYGEFLEAWGAMPPDGALYETQTGMLQTLLGVNADAFLDWDTGTCYFDGAAFCAMLEFCGSLPAENENWDVWPAMFDGEALEMTAVLGSFDGIMFDSISFHKALCGGEMTYIGYPTESGRVGSAFRLGREFAMTTACEDKAGAWTFLRTLLLPQGREVDYENFLDRADFAVNKADFRKMVEQAMTPVYAVDKQGNYRLDEEGNRIEEPKNSMSFGGNSYYCCDIYATTQEDYDQFMALYEATESLSDYDSALTDIIMEAAGACFAGDKTLDETAELIQNRANLYVSEQK